MTSYESHGFTYSCLLNNGFHSNSLSIVVAFETGVPNVRVVHHQDLNKRILVALIIASALLGGILLFLSCFWIYRRRKSENSNGKSTRRMGIHFSTETKFF